jgi:hypothetical protein
MDFDAAKTQWARKYFESATQYIEDVINYGHRFIVFSDGEHAVMGAACYIKNFDEVFGSFIDDTYYYDKFEKTRPIYGFFGFVVKKHDFSMLENKFDFKDLVPIFEKLISQRWKDTDINIPATATEYDYLMYVTHSNDNYTNLAFNDFQVHKCFAAPSDTDSNNEIIAAVINAVKNDSKLSLCTNMPNISSINDTIFMNATVKNILSSQMTINKLGCQPPISDKEPEKNRKNFKRKSEDDRYYKGNDSRKGSSKLITIEIECNEVTEKIVKGIKNLCQIIPEKIKCKDVKVSISDNEKENAESKINLDAEKYPDEAAIKQYINSNKTKGYASNYTTDESNKEKKDVFDF